MATQVLERHLEARLGEHLASFGITDPYLTPDGHLAPPPEGGWVRVRHHTPTVPVRVILDPVAPETDPTTTGEDLSDPIETETDGSTTGGPTTDGPTTDGPTTGEDLSDPIETDETDGSTTGGSTTGGDQAGAGAGGATSRLRAVLAEVGVPEGMVAVLTDVAVACATVVNPQITEPAAPEPAASDSAAGVLAGGPGHDDGHGDDGDGDGEVRGREVPDLYQAPAALARGRSLLTAVETLLAATGTLEGIAIAGTGQLTLALGRVLLADKGITDPEELSATARETWRGRAKSRTRHELAAATGWGPGPVSDLVSLATNPATITGPIGQAMAAGHAGWDLVRRYHRACSGLDTTDAAAIATALFGTDPATAVTERLTPEGEFTGGPWHHQEFHRALDREVTKVKSRDRDQSDKAREHAQAAADVRVRLDKEGTAVITIGATPAQGAAAADRIERAARAARAAGDPRTLRQLRTATALSLLLHGTLDTTDLPDDPALITTEQSAHLSKILHALPTAELNVIVPLTTLLGTTHLQPATGPDTGPDTGPWPVTADGTPVPAAFHQPPGTGAPPRDAPGCTCVCTCPARTPAANLDSDNSSDDNSSDDASDSDDPAAGGTVGGDTVGDGDPASDSDPAGDSDGAEVGVAEVIGRHSIFLTATEARVLALTPGSTMYRLVTDPVTGTLIERSTTAYRFDATMRAHIIAADVFCRAPGCLRPASLAQLDHVQEHGTPGGHTCISNGQPLDPTHHDLKTKKAWDAVMAANRAVTWTTLLGRIYTTKAHDYNQYTKLLTAATTAINEAITDGTAPADAIDDAIYQALTYRPPGAPHRATDDDPWNEDQYTGWDLIDTTHTTPAGRRVYRPHPDTLHAEQQRHRDSTADTGTGTDTRDSDTRENDRKDNARHSDDHGDDHGDPTTPWKEDPNGPPPF